MTRTSESDIEEIARTISSLAGPGMRPKQLVEAVRKKHPDATKKEISRGAFYAVILAAEKEPARAEGLHELASVTRNEFDD
ncbi:hypothetical protein V6582_09615 [Agrobacterium vitis]|uniref:hypothetical protein n=1 Tax=Agrobacterium vitis TaxID=373 RepID=UPI0012E7D178|nr:hypothetical protein [Agrobacterium vitis]MVA23902.1 hypothetical protein [Agrobacterium vitis]